MKNSSQNHSFDVKIAQDVGIIAATVLNHLHYWINHNRVTGKCQQEGKTWTFQSRQTMQEYLPYLSDKEIRHALEILVEKCYIIKGNFNKNKFDHTTWYTFADSAPCHPDREDSNNVFEGAERANRTCRKGQSTITEGPIDGPPGANPSIYSKDMKEDEKINKPAAPKADKNFLSFGSHVKLTQSQYDEFVNSHGKDFIESIIEDINNHCLSKDHSYPNYAGAMRTFIKNCDKFKTSSYSKKQKQPPIQKPKEIDENTLEYRMIIGRKEVDEQTFKKIQARAERDNNPDKAKGYKYINSQGELVET